MLREDREVTSIANFVQLIREDADRGIVWYRGLTDATYKLIPTLHRLSRPRTMKRPDESSLANRFKQNAHEFLDFHPRTEWEWMFLMRHHGVPSRLMDWTEGPLVGLFFAVNSVENTGRQTDNKDGVIWCLLPQVLNEASRITRSLTDPVPMFADELGPSTPSEEALEVYKISKMPSGRNANQGPAAAIGARVNKRMQAQRSVFTIHPQNNQPLEEYGTMNHVWRYIIPINSKATLREELNCLKVTRLSVFPDLDSLSTEIGKGLA